MVFTLCVRVLICLMLQCVVGLFRSLFLKVEVRGLPGAAPLPVSTVTSEHSLAPSLEPCQHFLGWVKLCQSSPQDFLIE